MTIISRSLLPDPRNSNIAVIGLGYVGLPLAVQFAKSKICCKSKNECKRVIYGFDINPIRIQQLNAGIDITKEVESNTLMDLENLQLTVNSSELTNADIFIVTVPTPIDNVNRPNLEPLISASRTVGLILRERLNVGIKTKPIVIYESTVYPGATEEVCIPEIEIASGLSLHNDFHCGYSPERINPGDKVHDICSIVKVVSASSKHVAEIVDDLYSSIITAGTYVASNIKVAEAAKVIENTQRDLNIALVNELSLIFERIGIDTLDVIEAAATKWNFLPFKPGLVGGHCIGVDPYYLTYKAEQLGYRAEVVLAGRRINDSMAKLLAEKLILEIVKKKSEIVGASILVMGLTFKENCPDLRNTKVIDFIKTLSKYNVSIDILDPCADSTEAKQLYGLDILSSFIPNKRYKGIFVAVGHSQFIELSEESWISLVDNNGVILDLKGLVPKSINVMRV